MARVRRIDIREDAKAVHPTEVDAEIRQVVSIDGTRLLQISTFGSDHRQSAPKVSQTLQFDRETAMQLRVAIEDCFGY